VSVRNPRKDVLRRKFIVFVLIFLFLVGLVLFIVSAAFVTCELWKTVLNIIGAFLAVSVATSFLYSVTLRPRDDAVRKEELRDLLDQKVEEIIEGRLVYGLDGFIQEMDYAQLFDDLNKGDELWWLDTYAPVYKAWIEHMGKAIDRGAKIKMLALDPRCQNADHRAEEIKGELYSPRRFKSELKNFIDNVSIYIKEKSGEEAAFLLRKYKDLPCIPIYLVCRENKPIYAYTSFFLGAPTGVEFPHMGWRSGERGLLNHFFDYIKNKWDRNGPSVGPSGTQRGT
jgi:hypothetical protein